jgi:hypothetical protein
LLDLGEVVRPQGAPGRDEIHDRIREPDERRKLHRPVKPDEVDMHAFRGEVLARRVHVLGGHAQPRAPAHRALVIEAPPHRHHHAAGGYAEIDRLVKAVAAVLHQHVAAGDA